MVFDTDKLDLKDFIYNKTFLTQFIWIAHTGMHKKVTAQAVLYRKHLYEVSGKQTNK